MKLITSILVIQLFSISTFAKNRYGLGVMIGAPTGISAKILRSKKHPLDAGISFGNNFEVHSTYLLPQKKRLVLERTRLRWYWGIGGKLKSVDKKDEDDEIYLGPRASIGINHYFKKLSLEGFAESAINVFVLPSSDVDLDITIGARYYF